MAALIQKCGKKTLSIYKDSKWYLKKGARSFYNETVNNGTSSSYSDYETTPKFNKSLGDNINFKFDIFIKTRCDLIIEADNKLF